MKYEADPSLGEDVDIAALVGAMFVVLMMFGLGVLFGWVVL